MGSIEVLPWQVELKSSHIRVGELLERLGLRASDLPGEADPDSPFPLRVTPHYLSLMRPGDPRDPLLLQVLPRKVENRPVPGFVADPLEEVRAGTSPGMLHKYSGRVLLILTQACAIHCRYCFRRNFPYGDHRRSLEAWSETLDQIARQPDITEVILSGGDPLVLPDAALFQILDKVEAIPHVRRLRIHTRFPVVLPSRFTGTLLDRLSRSRLRVVLVNHANHPQELDTQSARVFADLHRAGVTLLNQAVLLAGINDDLATLTRLFTTLFDQGVLPYYLHLTDRAAGTAHFHVSRERGLALYADLMARLPGYLVPKLAEEIPGRPSKTWWTPDRA